MDIYIYILYVVIYITIQCYYQIHVKSGLSISISVGIGRQHFFSNASHMIFSGSKIPPVECFCGFC